MVKHNNILPNVHLRKDWQNYVRLWFNQAGRKLRRRQARIAKAKAVAPRPVAGLLRPAVHPPTQRYNLKSREGRGFTLAELKQAKVSPKTARSVGLSVDHRRRNHCEETLAVNAARIAEYKSKLVLFPRKSGVKHAAKKDVSTRDQLSSAVQNTCKTVLPLPKVALKTKSRAITEEEKKFQAVDTLRTAWRLVKDQGKIFKINRARAEKERTN
eukprot:GDKJ01018667.1.p1 GENE.GDKJ01018667.1~~GDKJ01018667.1.p1  ORF type:complete len:213 (+),score=55.47 GDKJ01018667.1:24-662(+)